MVLRNVLVIIKDWLDVSLARQYDWLILDLFTYELLQYCKGVWKSSRTKKENRKTLIPERDVLWQFMRVFWVNKVSIYA